MVSPCVVQNCVNIGNHLFPKDISRKAKWIQAIKHVKPTLIIRENSRICSAHFRHSDFKRLPAYWKANKEHAPKVLKKTAIPSVFPWIVPQLQNQASQEELKPLVFDPMQVQANYSQSFRRKRDRMKNTAVPSLFLKPETAKVVRAEQQITPSSEPIPFVNVPATDPLRVCSMDKLKATVKIETEVKVEMEPTAATVCRTCLSDNAVTPLTDTCDEGCTLGDMLEDITGVRVAAGLPETICHICTGDLQSAIAFRRRAQYADKTLRQQTDIASAGDSLFPVLNVKCELPETDMLEQTSSNMVSTEEINVYGSHNSDHDFTAPIEDNESDVNWEPNKKAFKRPRGRPRKVQNTAKAANVRGQLVHKQAIHKNKIPCAKLKKGIDTSKKKPVQQVLKLKAIDKNQIPLAQLKKIKMIKLKPIQQQRPIKEIVIPSNNINPGTSGTVQSVVKSIYMPPLKRQKIIFQEPVMNTVKTYKLLPNEPESSQGDTQGTFACPHQGCSLTFPTHKVMIHHKYVSHLSENKLFLCLTCGKKSDTRQKALNHLKVHKKDNKEAVLMNCRIQCELCGIFFRVESQLERHISRTHKGERKYKCTECDRSFFSHNAMVMHHKCQHLPMGGHDRQGVQSADNNSDSTQDVGRHSE